MKLNQAETIIDLDKFINHNKRAANYYWNKNKRLAQIYIDRVRLYEQKKNL